VTLVFLLLVAGISSLISEVLGTMETSALIPTDWQMKWVLMATVDTLMSVTMPHDLCVTSILEFVTLMVAEISVGRESFLASSEAMVDELLYSSFTFHGFTESVDDILMKVISTLTQPGMERQFSAPNLDQ
jgi:hypothetical protein